MEGNGIMNIAYVVAHPDDVEIMSGGLFIKYRNQANCKICIIYLFTSEERLEESQSLYKKSNNIKIVNIENDIDILLEILVDFFPDKIITHNKNDIHFEHKATYEAVFQLIPKLRINNNVNFRLFGMETYNSVVPITDIYIDISKEMEQKLRLISSYSSQPVKYFSDMIISMNRMNGMKSGCEYAECYEEYPVMGVTQKSRKFL